MDEEDYRRYIAYQKEEIAHLKKQMALQQPVPMPGPREEPEWQEVTHRRPRAKKTRNRGEEDDPDDTAVVARVDMSKKMQSPIWRDNYTLVFNWLKDHHMPAKEANRVAFGVAMANKEMLYKVPESVVKLVTPDRRGFHSESSPTTPDT